MALDPTSRQLDLWPKSLLAHDLIYIGVFILRYTRQLKGERGLSLTTA
jgi:hypothetical protein